MRFYRLSEEVNGQPRPPLSGWMVVPQSRSSGRETPVTEFVMCSWHKLLPHVIGIGPQWATTNVRQKATVVCEVRGSRSNKRLMYEPLHVIWPWPCSSDRVYNCGRGLGRPHKHKSTMAALRYVVHFRFFMDGVMFAHNGQEYAYPQSDSAGGSTDLTPRRMLILTY